MASKQTGTEAFAPVLEALATMQSNVARDQKNQAHEFLEKFQKSVEAWQATIALLQLDGAPVESKLFAATTLKGKITYDLDQLPTESVPALRDSVLALLNTYGSGPRPIRTQLCVCLASLAIQMTRWENVLGTVGSALGSNGDCVLEFLKILPEEVTEGRKINLTEDELWVRTKELLSDNYQQVLGLMIQYSQSSGDAPFNPRLLECITSWLREIPAADIVNSPLLDVILKALTNDSSFEAAVECLVTICNDTRDVDESVGVIRVLYPKILGLRPRIAEAAEAEDTESLRGITKLFSEAGHAWTVLIARLPREFRALVEAILECCARDSEREAISLTFDFWYELKQLLTLEKYTEARAEMTDLYSKLVDIMIGHLEFPKPESAGEDLFEGDRDQEEKFRAFRHDMGDVLKDCCAVIGVDQCLQKSYTLIQQWVAKYGPQASDSHVPNWQELEAPLFSMRAMGRMVDPEKTSVLGELIQLIVQIPDQDKVRFQAIMVLARYTEWTAQHPETLDAQLKYIIQGFQNSQKEVVQASAVAFKYLGVSCSKLMLGHLQDLLGFYDSILDKLSPLSQEEVTEGVASIIAAQPLDKLHDSMKSFCDPVVRRVMALANNAQDEDGQKAVADHVQLITWFIQVVAPYVPPNEPHPVVQYCESLLPVLATLAVNFTQSVPILERVCRCWRYMMISYRISMAPLLPTLAQNIAAGFQASRQGCFLFATDAVIREFSDGMEFVDQTTSDAVYQFFEEQAVAFLRILNDIPPQDLPDVIEDFFRLMVDAVRYYPVKTLTSPLAEPIVSAALTALTLHQLEPLLATLQYLRDLLSFGTTHPLISQVDNEPYTNPPEAQAAVKNLIVSQGQVLVQRILTGMMFSFPGDCFSEASAVLMTLFEIDGPQAGAWVQSTIQMLPAGSLKAGEAERLMNGISQTVQSNEMRKIRVLIQDFTNSYRRRNVAPRDGLGRLEATKFRFSG